MLVTPADTRRRVWGDIRDHEKRFREFGLGFDEELLAEATSRLEGIALLAVPSLRSELRVFYSRIGSVSPATLLVKAEELKVLCNSILVLIVDALKFVRPQVENDDLRAFALDCSREYLSLLAIQFEGPLQSKLRLEVTASFDGALRLMTLLQSIGYVRKGGHQLRSCKPIEDDPAAARVCEEILRLTAMLLTHITAQFKHIDKDRRASGQSRDLVAWLLFGCKFINSVAGLVGEGKEDFNSLIASFVDLEKRLQH